MSQPTKKVLVDEDFDDLDDVLDEFNAPPPPPAVTAPAPAPARPAGSTLSSGANINSGTIPDEDDFTKELAEGMEALMRELSGAGPTPGELGAASTSTSQTEQEKEKAKAFAAAWEAMLVEGMGAEAWTADKATTAGRAQAQAGAAPEDAFAKTIREAMERMQDSEANLQADASSSADADPLAALLASLGDGDGGEDNLSGMLEGMMGQLMSKEVLYEPLKELRDKFPDYIKENENKFSNQEKKSYLAQNESVRRIVEIFEDPKYSDEDVSCSAKVVELMNEMQSYGSPPPELMGPMPAGLETGPDGLPKLPEGCTIM